MKSFAILTDVTKCIGCEECVTACKNANETGAEVLRSPLHYPSEGGGWQLGNIDFGEHLAKYRDHEVVVIIASIGKAGEVEKEKYICGICGFALNELGECPRCKLQVEETAKELRSRRQKQSMWRQIEEILEEKQDDPGQEDVE